uniref:PilZ domain-containing protein n=1 Tax=Altererythrobacter segetis TaxID=1104773 RepID=UPI00140998CC|nr:PilZ domain-containing protein [Altererythrobacter segetis]
MALEAHKAFIETSRDARGRIRHSLHLEVGTRTSGSLSHGTTVHNISESGILLETSASLAIGDVVEVDLPHIGLRSARVMWTSDQLLGCKFDDPLSTAGVSAARLSGTFPSLLPDTSLQVPKAAPVHAEQLSTPPVVGLGELSPRTKLAIMLGLAVLAWVLLGAFAYWVLS